MNPAGYVGSVRTFASILTRRCFKIAVTSRPVNAYFSRFRRKIVNGNDSRNLCGPGDGRGAYVPLSLSSIHDDGAASRFKCFFGPRAYRTKSQRSYIHTPCPPSTPIPLFPKHPNIHSQETSTSKTHTIINSLQFSLDVGSQIQLLGEVWQKTISRDYTTKSMTLAHSSP